jgi:hypothetical protein
MKTAKPLGTLTILAAVALIQHRFVTSAGTVPAAGVYCPGAANDNYAAGEPAGVDFSGIVLVESGAAIAADAAVQTDASGRAITLAAGVNLGRALDAATAAGEFIRVKLA